MDLLTIDRGGRAVRGYDTGSTGRADELVVGWHGGTPNTGEPPGPLLDESARLGIRWIGADRPGYGGSDVDPTATLATAVHDLAAVADALGVARFAALGHSGGGPRALASAALLPDRVPAAVAISSTAPWPAEGLDWFAGFAPAVERELRAALEGRAALEAVLAEDVFDPSVFVPSDRAALEGDWAWFDRIVAEATADGLAGFVQDDLASMGPWGFALETVRAPVLVVHGLADRFVPPAHGRWLADRIPVARFEPVPDAGHIAALAVAPTALQWLRATAG